MKPREQVVRRLMRHISHGMERACERDPTITSDEVFSASITQARDMVVVARDNGANPRTLRAYIEQLLMELPHERIM